MDGARKMIDDRLTQMFQKQHELLAQSYGVIPQRMSRDERIQCVKDMVLAATDELHEALGETNWKPWSSGTRAINVDAYVGELVDVWHFLMNLMLTAGFEPTEAADRLYEGYLTKRGINERRQLDGYDGTSTKCVHCKRALDDPAVTCWRRGDQAYCAEVGADINFVS